MKKLSLAILGLIAVVGGAVAMSGQVEAEAKNVETNKIMGVPEELQLQSNDKYIGKIDAPVQIVEYASMTCGHCGHFYNDSFEKLKENYIDTGKVRFVMRHLPWDNLALAVSKVIECAPEEQRESFIGVFMQAQEQWIVDNPLPAIKRLVRLGGMTGEKVEQCIADEDLQQEIAEVKRVAVDVLKVRSTPTFFVNGQLVEGAVPYQVMANTIDGMLK